MQLIIAEKPSVGQAIGKALHIISRKDGYLEGKDYLISWCMGHLLTTAYPDVYGEQYAQWKLENLPIIPQKWIYIPPSEERKRKQYETLKKLLGDTRIDGVICATDAGREGELIFRHLYNYCGCTKPVQRLWISSMEEEAIQEGFAKLKDGKEYDSLYQAALCREKADWLVGLNATRLFSIVYDHPLNVGRVVTPTLAMIVEREGRIKDFKKVPFYEIELDFNDFQATSKRIEGKEAADEIISRCKGKTGTVISIQMEEKRIPPPHLYDLTTLQREANRAFGYTAQETLDCIQTLYEKKLTTYPRTDSKYLTEDMKDTIPPLIESIKENFPFSAPLAIPMNTSQIIQNDKVNDHHAIIPTSQVNKVNLAALPTNERKLLTMIAMRLFCAVGEVSTYSETTVKIQCTDIEFTAKGRTVLQAGWKEIERKFMQQEKGCTEEEKDSPVIPDLSEGQEITVNEVNLHKGFTSPPKRYTEDTLLSAMEQAGSQDMPDDAERKGIGTPATRAGILEKLVDKKLIERKKKNLVPTEKGIRLVSILPDSVKSPVLTADWETRLKEIEKGRLNADDFIEDITAFLESLVETHAKLAGQNQDLFEDERGRKEIGRCPRCNHAVYEGKKNYYCSSHNCQFTMWKDDNFFQKKKKTLTPQIASGLLKNGSFAVKNLYSEKTGKTYDATVFLSDTGGKYVNYRLEFTKK